jgi:hypothetical protein
MLAAAVAQVIQAAQEAMAEVVLGLRSVEMELLELQTVAAAAAAPDGRVTLTEEMVAQV